MNHTLQIIKNKYLTFIKIGITFLKSVFFKKIASLWISLNDTYYLYLKA